MTAVTRTERQDRDRQRSNTSSAASGAATAGGYPRIPVLAPGEVVFRDPRVSRYSKNSSIVTNVGDFVVSVASMVSSYQGNIFSYPDGQLSSRIKLISNSYSSIFKKRRNAWLPRARTGGGRPRAVGAINFDHICTFLGKPPVRRGPRRAGTLSRSRFFDAAHVLATVTIPLLPSAGIECYNLHSAALLSGASCTACTNSFGHGQFSRTPPSMISSVPVMLLESSDSRNLAARATSSDVPNRFKSDLAANDSSNPFSWSAGRPTFFNIGVSIGPGLNTFTRTPRGANSTAKVLPREMTAALVAVDRPPGQCNRTSDGGREYDRARIA